MPQSCLYKSLSLAQFFFPCILLPHTQAEWEWELHQKTNETRQAYLWEAFGAGGIEREGIVHEEEKWSVPHARQDWEITTSDWQNSTSRMLGDEVCSKGLRCIRKKVIWILLLHWSLRHCLMSWYTLSHSAHCAGTLAAQAFERLRRRDILWDQPRLHSEFQGILG